MECQTDDFSVHLDTKLKDPVHAAGYLRACLKDAIAEKDYEHYFSAIEDVKRAQGMDTLWMSPEEVRDLIHRKPFHRPRVRRIPEPPEP
jgi:DNA-binding phage protein